MAADKNMNRDTALMDIYRVMRPGEPPTVEAAFEPVRHAFLYADRYDLFRVGRVKRNMRPGARQGRHARTLDRYDIVACIKRWLTCATPWRHRRYDHLGNRRVRSVGELMEKPVPRVGHAPMERAIKELCLPSQD